MSFEECINGINDKYERIANQAVDGGYSQTYIDAIDSRVANNETDIDAIDSRVANNETDIDAIDNKLHIVDTIADLKAYTGSAQRIYVSGYHTKDDGAFGSNVFKFIGEVVDASEDNGGTVQVVNIDNKYYKYELQYDGDINIKWFGAKCDGITDDSEAINKVILNGFREIEIHKKARFEEIIDFSPLLGGNIKIVGIGNCTVETIDAAKWNFNGSTLGEYDVLTTDANILDYSFTAGDGTKYAIGDYISFRSDEVAETGWNYISQGTYIVTSVNGDNIGLDRPLRFNFKKVDNARVYITKNKTNVTIENIDFINNTSIDNVIALQFTLMNNITLNGCSVNQMGIGVANTGIQFDRASNVLINNFKGKNTRYPIAFAAGYGAKINNIHGDNVRHLVDFSSWFEYAIIDGFSGNTTEGGVNAHPSFDITYKNGSTLDFYAPSNFRWFGGGCEDVNIKIAGTAGGTGMYSGIVMDNGNYPDYTDNLEALGLMAYFNNVTIDDTQRASGGTYQGRGFNIGMSGTFDNITNIGGDSTYIEERKLDITLGKITPATLSNKSSYGTSVRRLTNINRDAVQDTTNLDLYRATEDSANVEVVYNAETDSYESYSKGFLVARSVHTGKVVTIKISAFNQKYKRINSQYITIKLTYRSWHGVATKKIFLKNRPSDGTSAVTFIGETATETTDSAAADMVISNYINDDEVSSNLNAPIQFDIEVVTSDANRPFTIEYECQSSATIL